MKSCLGMLIALIILIAVIGAAAGIYYLSSTSEFERKEAPSR
ncbi:MAG: hypothetical protein AAGI48_00785 [Verrucomicrobiota bacterium]